MDTKAVVTALKAGKKWYQVDEVISIIETGEVPQKAEKPAKAEKAAPAKMKKAAGTDAKKGKAKKGSKKAKAEKVDAEKVPAFVGPIGEPVPAA